MVLNYGYFVKILGKEVCPPYLCTSYCTNTYHKMEIYVVTLNSKVEKEGYVSLAALCKDYSLDYSSASKGKRVWIDGDNLTVVSAVTVNRIKGRGNNFKTKGI